MRRQLSPPVHRRTRHMHNNATMSTAADTLRDHLAQVEQLRQSTFNAPPALREALAAVRLVQVRRFHFTYADFLASPRHGQAARFFLTELYGSHDYSQRDAQFARIAGAIERLFPAKVMALAVQMAEVHALTESLDWQLAQAWVGLLPGTSAATSDAARAVPAGQTPTSAETARLMASRYLACWRQVGRPQDRQRQLDAVMALGWHLAEVVRIPGLRMALRLMRKPAQAAGLTALQLVLETGFDAFTSMGKPDGFLNDVQARETDWIGSFFNADLPAITARLAGALQSGQPSPG